MLSCVSLRRVCEASSGTRHRDVHLRGADLGDKLCHAYLVLGGNGLLPLHLPFQRVQLISCFRSPGELQGGEGRAGRQAGSSLKRPQGRAPSGDSCYLRAQVIQDVFSQVQETGKKVLTLCKHQHPQKPPSRGREIKEARGGQGCLFVLRG